MPWWLYILLGIIFLAVLGGLGAMLYITVPIAKRVYFEQLVKTSDEKWGRVCSAPDNEEQLAMWNAGIEWAEPHKAVMKEVEIENDGLKLYGEYYDFGSDNCAIILPGRCECLIYSYYFVEPYRRAGMNVLVIDSRCHGKSDGKYSTIGLGESEDIKAWIRYMEKEFAIKSFWLHGICIGSGGALLAAKSEDIAEKIGGIVLEGCFVDFRESFKQHMITDNRPIFPVLDLVMHNIKRYAGVDVMKIAPIKLVKHIHCPILFLFGRQDKFSIPPKSVKLFGACASEEKKLVWFDEGCHSHLRINNTEQYDDSIVEFVEKYEK